MNSKKKRDLNLIGFIVGVHIVSLIVMWWFLSSDDIIETEFLKVISVTLTTNPSKPLPPINEAARNKIAEEKKQKIEAEKAAKAAKEKSIRDKKAKADKLKKDSEQKKIKDKATKEANDKAKAAKTKKDKAAAKTKADKLKKDKAAAKARADKLKKDKAAATAIANKARAAKIAREKVAAKARADKAAKAAAYKKQQTAFGQHINQKTYDQLVREWNRLPFSIQFSDPSDKVTITITIRKDGTVVKAAILKKAKGQALNSQAQHLVKILTSGRYRFTSFPSSYAQSTQTFSWDFRAELKN